MDADAHPDLASARPGVVRQAALAHHRRPDSVRCGFREDGKQRVAATAQDLAACRLESGSEKARVEAEQTSVGLVADRAEETRRSFNVGEDQRDGTGNVTALGFAAADHRG